MSITPDTLDRGDIVRDAFGRNAAVYLTEYLGSGRWALDTVTLIGHEYVTTVLEQGETVELVQRWEQVA